MEVTLDRFKCKPVKQIILGQEMLVPPLRTKFYTSLLKSQMIETRILSKGFDNQEPTEEELKEKADIDSDIAFSVLKEMCPEIDRNFFDNEMPAIVIPQIIEGTTRASGLTDEKMRDIREKFNRIAKLKEIERNKKDEKSTSEKGKSEQS